MKKRILVMITATIFFAGCNNRTSNYIPISNTISEKEIENKSENDSDSALAIEEIIEKDFNNNTQSPGHIIDNNDETKGIDESMIPKEPVIPEEVTPINTPDSVTSLVNKLYYLPSNYIPNDLMIPNVRFSFEGYDDKMLLREVAAIALEDLFNAAEEEENLFLFAVSGYRSYQRQKAIYERNLQTRGEEWTNKYSAKPGHSEHQTGLAMDVTSKAVGFNLTSEFASTPEGQWLKANAHRFGFVISYPADKTHITGYNFEPWHIRYVGIDLADILTDNNITLDEYYYMNNLTP
ncbi:D-alanyl-D-alanine carboxypeptidase [Natranaerovirga pectinivora]|uniref:D-alanyl-D-alanine carboxypeptidase n=1 Tax=Natranaerovirga pectinivora TaxID=682400 RepID=A0A4R3MJ05_9FIRM|nr:M15 family metallopeptidase [Natranaerovirga pectinivora]TCT13993.1 D-alanyl-D-alanine carboxypeptidase [Natranaerovirga pectinivora]